MSIHEISGWFHNKDIQYVHVIGTVKDGLETVELVWESHFESDLGT